MGLFGKRKKRKAAERKKLEELALQEKIKEEKKAILEAEAKEKKAKELAKVEAEKKKPEPAKKTAPIKKEVPVKKAAPVKKTTKKVETKKSPSGKYEIFLEAGLYKFRLKASNGEILAVSFGYASKRGAKTGIQTFKQACENGNFEISTDKSGFSHFDLFGARGARVIIIGEFYKTLKLAESAVESVKKFYLSDRIVEIEALSPSEVREELVAFQKVESKENGKYIVEKQGPKAFFVKLAASNGQVLLVSQKYTTKQSALNGLDAFKNAINNQNFTIYRDKQDRYQYKLYTDNKQLIISGETYPAKQSCLSAIQSVLRFAVKAKLVEKN